MSAWRGEADLAQVMRGVANGARDEDIREAVPKADIPFSYAGLAGRFLPRSLAALVRPPSITH